MAQAQEFKASPPQLTFSAHQNDPVAYCIEIDTRQPTSATSLIIEISEFDFDRIIRPINSTRYQIWLAPNTLRCEPHIYAAMNVFIKGTDASVSIPVEGKIQPWISVEPSVINLGFVTPARDSSTEKIRKIDLILSAEKSFLVQ